MALLYAGKPGRRVSKGLWSFIALIYILIVGLRMSGGDWYNYWWRFKEMVNLSLSQALTLSDPGYELINYSMYHWGLGFFAETLIFAFLSIAGLFIFLRSQINPWLGLAISVPYLMIVVYMGYMRQGVALGLIMWGIVALERGRFYRFLAFLTLAVTFHKTAVVMIAFGIFSTGKGKFLKFFGVLAGGIGVWSAFVSSGAETLIHNYVDANMHSSGAVVRVLINAVAAILLLVYRKEWKHSFRDYTFWFMISLASLAMVGLVSIASTAVDRMALYFLPLQVVVFSRLPYLARKNLSPKVTTVLILLFYLLLLVVWMNFGVNSRYWIPYKNFLWAGLF